MGMCHWFSIGSSVGFLAIIYILRRLVRRSQRCSVKDKVVLITGASSGLGEACARAFYEAGAKVILCARRTNELERVKESLVQDMQAGRHVPHIVSLDLAEYDALPSKIEQAILIHGTIDILINNGGMSYRGEIADTGLDVDQRVMAVNYFGQVAITKALLPHMMSRRTGHIVTVSSLQGRISIPHRSAYSASKHAIQAFCDCLRAEMAEHNIRVSVFSPGYIQTNLSLNAVTATGDNYGVLDANTASGMKAGEAANHVLGMVTNNEQDMLAAKLHHCLAVYLRHFAPSVYFWVMARRAKKESLKKKTQ